MAKYHFTKRAVEDLPINWDYTYKHWPEKQADTYYDLLISACNELAKNSKLGKRCNFISNGILGYKSGEHIVFYTIISKKEIEVTRILHGMMALKSKL